MATIAPQLFSRSEDNLEDEEQLLKLFWNRAELKKELAKLRGESYRLIEQVKKQEAKTLRVQQHLQQLETSLGNPEHALTAVAYYQLKGVWEHCHQRLATLSAELERAQYDKGYRIHIAAFKRDLNDSLIGVGQELRELTETADLLAAQIRTMRGQRDMLAGLWNFFGRRKLTNQIYTVTEEHDLVRARVAGLSEEIQTRTAREAPDYAGLDLAAKRSINLTLIAYAQELFLTFMDRDLAKLAREASIRQLTGVAYGSRRDCRALSKQIEDRMRLLAADRKLKSRVQVRAAALSARVSYARDKDTVPTAATLGSIALLKPDGRERGAVGMNVLGEEYWDVFAVLLV